jgi:hypothetical protein
MKQVIKSVSLLLTLVMVLASCSSGGGNAPGPTYNKIFITSAAGDGNLGGWPQAGSNTGLAAGDAICQSLATAKGLSGTYKAWLSDGTTDAYCHVQGFDGFKVSDASGCGQSSMPTAAGPWMRMDGNPFADTIDKLVNNEQVFTPPQYDENGSPVTGVSIFTGTDDNGVLNTSYAVNPCSNWTSNNGANHLTVGSPSGATLWWTSSGEGACSDTNRLICMQTGTGTALPARAIPAGAKRVFVTSVYDIGDLSGWADANGYSGILAGDAICQARALAGSLANPTNYVAWLSDGSENAIDRIAEGARYRLDGIKIANSKADLTDGTIFTAISYNELGNYMGWYAAWTGTNASGNKTTNHCNNWGDGTSSYNGVIGSTSETNTGWTNEYDTGCGGNGVLYCFEN